MGQREVGTQRRVHGAAIINAKTVRSAELEVRVGGEPPPRHANIVGWPWHKDDPDFGKAKQKELAALIAQKAGEPVRL